MNIFDQLLILPLLTPIFGALMAILFKKFLGSHIRFKNWFIIPTSFISLAMLYYIYLTISHLVDGHYISNPLIVHLIVSVYLGFILLPILFTPRIEHPASIFALLTSGVILLFSNGGAIISFGTESDPSMIIQAFPAFLGDIIAIILITKFKTSISYESDSLNSPLIPILVYSSIFSIVFLLSKGTEKLSHPYIKFKLIENCTDENGKTICPSLEDLKNSEFGIDKNENGIRDDLELRLKVERAKYRDDKSMLERFDRLEKYYSLDFAKTGLLG